MPLSRDKELKELQMERKTAKSYVCVVEVFNYEGKHLHEALFKFDTEEERIAFVKGISLMYFNEPEFNAFVKGQKYTRSHNKKKMYTEARLKGLKFALSQPR